MLDLLKRAFEGAARRFRVRRRHSYEFGTRDRGRDPGSQLQPGRHAQLLSVAAVLAAVEASPLVRTVAPQEGPMGATEAARVERLEIHTGGLLGTIRIPGNSEIELNDDVDGMTLETVGSDGSTLVAFCSGISGDNAGIVVGIVLAPSPPPGVTSVRFSLSPLLRRWQPASGLDVVAALS